MSSTESEKALHKFQRPSWYNTWHRSKLESKPEIEGLWVELWSPRRYTEILTVTLLAHRVFAAAVRLTWSYWRRVGMTGALTRRGEETQVENTHGEGDFYMTREAETVIHLWAKNMLWLGQCQKLGESPNTFLPRAFQHHDSRLPAFGTAREHLPIVYATPSVVYCWAVPGDEYRYQLKNGQSMSADLPPKKTNTWPISTWQYTILPVIFHQLPTSLLASGKCKSKPPWGHPPTLLGGVSWCSCWGKPGVPQKLTYRLTIWSSNSIRFYVHVRQKRKEACKQNPVRKYSSGTAHTGYNAETARMVTGGWMHADPPTHDHSGMEEWSTDQR